MENTDERRRVWIIYSTSPGHETQIPHIVMGNEQQFETYMEVLRAQATSPNGSANFIDSQRLTLTQLKFMNNELDC